MGVESAIVPVRAPDVPPVPPRVWPEEEGPWRLSHVLWNQQQRFDERLHRERCLLFPQDVHGEGRARSTRQWVLGVCFAFLEELAELLQADEADNADEETVDTLHFVLSLAARLGLEPRGLGRFEDRFHRASAAAGQAPWQEVLHRVLPEYVEALSDLKGAHHKWWKDQETDPAWSPQVAALLRIDHCNMMVASRVFASPQQMFERYMQKVEHNHARQRGEVASRPEYAAPRTRE